MIKNFNFNWEFRYCEGEEFTAIALPHTFELPYYGNSVFYVGDGFYKKSFHISKAELKSVVVLQFYGVFQECDISVNGKFVHNNRGGYDAFHFEITPYLVEGENLVEVSVNNRWQGDLAPRAGEHTFCGGIYRDVKLLVLPKSHIDINGVFVKTTVAQGNADLEIDFTTVNAVGKEIKNTIITQNGEVVAEFAFKVEKDEERQNLTIKNPRFWSPEQPNLYTLVSVLDKEETKTVFGIRTIRFSEKEGFFLNGKRYDIEGVNVHQDHGGWGDATTVAGIRRDLLMMREAGFNFVRGSHYPKHPEFAKICDEIGLLFWSEATFWGIGGFKDADYWTASAMPSDGETAQRFGESCKKAMAAMIKYNRNSPSIIVWSVGNEMFFTADETVDSAKKLITDMLEMAKKLDPTRASGVGGTQRKGFHKLGDVTGFNGDGATLFKAPKIPNMVSEYGSITAERPGEAKLYLSAGVEKKPVWRCGRALWCGFHHGSIADIGNMGIADIYRLPLRAFFAYRKALRGIEMPEFPTKTLPVRIEISADKQSFVADGTDDVMLIVKAYDAHGKRCVLDKNVVLTTEKGLFPSGKTWVMTKENKTFADGLGAIEMRAYNGGEIKVKAEVEGLESAEIIVNAVNGEEKQLAEIVFAKCPPPFVPDTDRETNILADRPCLASSNTEDAPLPLSGEGEWRGSAEKGEFWRVDTERMYTISKLNLDCGDDATKLKIYVSADGSEWIKVYSSGLFPKKCDGINIKLKKNKGRFLKIVWSKKAVLRGIKGYL